MSNWTYINGTITISPMGRTQSEKKYILETVLEHLPRVTGSEGDMNIYIIQSKGNNESCPCDEFGMCTNNLIDYYGNKTDNATGWLEIQRNYILVLEAHLRDREFNETYKEFQKWLCRLAKRINIDKLLVKISDGWINKIISNAKPYSDMFESPSWIQDKEEFPEPNWCEYLMWDRAKDSDMPIILKYKYFRDKQNDKEAIKRINYER